MDKVIYYSDELNDDFSGIKRDTITVDEKYKYKRSLLWRFFSMFLYRIIMTPIAFLYMKIKFGFKVVNKKALKKERKNGYFMYANHTLVPADGYMPSCVAFPKRVMVVVNADNISLKGTKNFMAMIGATPIPNKLNGMRNFKEAIHHYINKKRVVMIYPEAHIWPYYTGIRNFKATSFAYPIKEDTASYCFTVTYQKKLIGIRITAFVDGPFYPNKDVDEKTAQKELRDKIYSTMLERSKNSTYEKIKYIYKEN